MSTSAWGLNVLLLAAIVLSPVGSLADSPYTDEANRGVGKCISKGPHDLRKITARIEVGRWISSRENPEHRASRVVPAAVLLLSDNTLACRWQVALGDEPFQYSGTFSAVDPKATIEISEDGSVIRRYIVTTNRVYSEQSKTYRDLDPELAELLQRLTFDFLPPFEKTEGLGRTPRTD